MLVIDRENDRALLAKRPMRIARLYTCLSGFTEVHVLIILRHFHFVARSQKVFWYSMKLHSLFLLATIN